MFYYHHPYCWWKKSCTTWDVQTPINNGISTISTHPGFQPSTVSSHVNKALRPAISWMGEALQVPRPQHEWRAIILAILPGGWPLNSGNDPGPTTWRCPLKKGPYQKMMAWKMYVFPASNMFFFLVGVSMLNFKGYVPYLTGGILVSSSKHL